MWAFAEAAWVFKGNWVPSEQVIQEKKRNQAKELELSLLLNNEEPQRSKVNDQSSALGVFF